MCTVSAAPQNMPFDKATTPTIQSNPNVSVLVQRRQAGSAVANLFRKHWAKLTGLTLLCVGGTVWLATRGDSDTQPLTTQDHETALTIEALDAFEAVPVSFKSRSSGDLITIEMKGNETLWAIKEMLKIKQVVRLEFNDKWMTDYTGRDHNDLFMCFISRHGGPVSVGKFREWLKNHPPLSIVDDNATPSLN